MKGHHMYFSNLRSLSFACAVICGVWFLPQSGSAELAPLTLDPVATTSAVSNGSTSRAGAPAEPLSLSQPTTQPTADDSSGEDPIYACACGCGIYEVGTASMLPRGQGGMVYLEYDYQDQNINWSGVRPAPGSDNDDVNIRTNFYTLGLQYFFTRAWGIQVELPYDNRHFETATAAPGGGEATLQWGALGDVRLEGIYAGFFDDQSLGVDFGLKLPTGNYTHNNRWGDADRDSELGTGSLDVLLGGFYRHQFTDNLTGFTQVLLDVPCDEVAGYRPGIEADGSFGAYFTGLSLGRVQITPVAQVLVAERGHDSGPNAAHPIASGYQRVLLSPGLEFDVHPFEIYTDIEVPVYQHFSGDQLTAPFLFKLIFSYHF
jgi:hypothetical protein